MKNEEKNIKSSRAEAEEKVLAFWKENNIFQKSVDKTAPQGDFVFYEGPPTANGRPGIHHLEARAFKDIIPRYKTMRGFHVERKAGWDTHGLPVEIEVEKKLGFKSKKDIEAYGIAKFNEECMRSVWTYVDEWKEFTDRMGYWVDMEHPYVTYKPDYIESVWNIVGQIAKQDLLYRDYKVVPWCPRDGTALSSHELAQGYQDDKDLSVTVKFKVVGQDDTYLLAWTTTPWTLPGNVALAVGEKLDYVKVEIEGGFAWLEKTRAKVLLPEAKVAEEAKGKKLVGLEYEPLYPYLADSLPAKQKDKLKNAYKVYPADFVTTEDGTGIVHTAVMYGQDDFELGTKFDLPKHHLVDDTGHFVKGTGFLEGRYAKEVDEKGKPTLAVDITLDLKKRGLWFAQENITHTYPHCWRCGTPLIYYARDSWYIRMSSLRDTLISENEKINWEPSYIRDGRFGEWLREVKDWAISRERYWGTPLPVWLSEDKHDMLVVDSIDTLKKYTKKSGNSYFVMRHGEAKNNVEHICTRDPKNMFPLTEVGEKSVDDVAKELKKNQIDLIVSSPVLRAKQTAEQVLATLGLPPEALIMDDRLMEIDFGDLEGKGIDEYHAVIKNDEGGLFNGHITHGEDYADVAKRVGALLYELEDAYKGRRILIVSHADPIIITRAVCEGTGRDGVRAIFETNYPKNALVSELPFVPLPHDKNFELDLHRPFIDEIVLEKDGKELRRVKEVMDVWFDSGSMPFAQYHYPFEHKDDLPYPADYISEAIDQTRGWFYTLHAIGVLTGRGLAYKNVICLGHLLDKDGKKMSKSLGNTVNPFEMIDMFGVDALRYWMYTINQPGESKNFDPRTVDEVVKKVFNLVLNVMKFYEPYMSTSGSEVDTEHTSANVLDQWILALLDDMVFRMTKYLDDYKILEAARMIRDFIGDLSQWYLRRSRDRFRLARPSSGGGGDDESDKQAAIDTLGFVLKRLAIVMAPFMPFLAEDIYQKLRGDNSPESVHLETWPEVLAQSVGSVLVLNNMTEVRRLVTLGLEARSKAGIKVRQPLSSLTLKSTTLQTQDGYLSVLQDEVNVKQIAFDPDQAEEVVLDTIITEELQKEGDIRELIRAIQEARKEKDLQPSDKVAATLHVRANEKVLVEESIELIKKSTNLSDITLLDLPDGEGEAFTITLD